MRPSHPLVEKTLLSLRKWRWPIVGGALLLAGVLTASWLISMATRPLRLTSPRLPLDEYGYPGVVLSITHPSKLSPQSRSPIDTRVTVSALALAPEAVVSLELALSLPDEAITFVDASGQHTSGRLTVTPGYPDALPYDLYLAHGHTQLRGTWLRAYRVAIVPTIRTDSQVIPIDALAFDVRLTSMSEQAVRGLATALVATAPYLLIAALLMLGAWVAFQLTRRRRQRHAKLLATAYGRLREHIKLQHWADARSQIERLRLEAPHYRDVDQLDTIVSAAETAAWRREQLYKAGIEAYRHREWPSAVQSFTAIEQETPYYRDVRFLSRTAALYADLGSRDRSRRIAAARELGEVADLVDMQPLITALGDPSAEVSQAAQEALARIGVGATDALLGGLVHGSTAVRQAAYRLLEKLGQGAREALGDALHSSDPEMTRQVAQLLVPLGARKELANALLWASEPHLTGLVAALQLEGNTGVNALVEALQQAPPARRPVIINALAALKQCADVERRLEEAIRASRAPEVRTLLEQALAAKAAPFEVPPPLALPCTPVQPAIATTTPAPTKTATPRRRFLRRAHDKRLEAAGNDPTCRQQSTTN